MPHRALRHSPILLCLLPAALFAAGPAADGYLPAGALDLVAILPPAPAAGDARDEADRRTFRETRRLAGSSRWRAAAADAAIGPAETMRAFSCAVGAKLTPAAAPRLTAMVGRAMIDIGPAVTVLKDHYRRLRPYRTMAGPTCTPTAELGDSFDYPSGHTMYGWTWATILAQAVPARATAIMARGNRYGESRYLCGVHNLSAVQSGQAAATLMLAIAAATPAYQADLAAVREEVEDLRRRDGGTTVAACDAAGASGMKTQPEQQVTVPAVH